MDSVEREREREFRKRLEYGFDILAYEISPFSLLSIFNDPLTGKIIIYTILKRKREREREINLGAIE